ncbi:hypothetical protein M126_2010 [Bacteroides fragilis str. S6L3]|nr:hypothetical protein M126_2010 [Bacteroides fragilis str. S6L3]EYB05083.1 hypothetical protein M129_1856 [Bacteroides fragilis str. S6R5]
MRTAQQPFFLPSVRLSFPTCQPTVRKSACQTQAEPGIPVS